MSVVNRDVGATGVGHPCQLRVRVDEMLSSGGNAYVETQDRYTSASGGIFPASGADPLTALVAVADDAQEALMEALWEAWPVCPAHRLGVHARDHEQRAVWWCTGDGGHAVAAIGEWQAS